jgi:hypothetical protein
MTNSHSLFAKDKMNLVERIVNMIPDSLGVPEVSEEENQQQEESQKGPVTNLSAVTRGKERKRGATARVGTNKPLLRRSSQSTDSGTLLTVAETIFNSVSSSASSERSSTCTRRFFKTPSQRKLQEQLQKRPQMANRRESQNNSSSLLSALRLDQEEVEVGSHVTNIRQGIENARRNLSSMRKWNTPYDIDPPRRIRLASERSLATATSSSTAMSSSTMGSDPMGVERQIWNGIEALMADAFSEGGETVRTEDVLPKSLIRAMSMRSVSTNISPASQLTPEEVDEIQMAQLALNSFMDMLLPEETKEDANHESDGTMPSLDTVRDSDTAQGGPDHIAMAEVALHNFMDVLLHDLEKDLVSENSSKVQILDLFQWSLKINIDAHEKIKYLERERLRLEQERERELEDLMESERRLERERTRRELEEEKRRRRIQLLEQQLAQEQQALAKAQSKTYHAMIRNASPREPPIAEEEQVDRWESTPGGKPVVISSDERSSDPATLPFLRPKIPNRGLQDLQESTGDISTESEAALQYIVTSQEKSPSKKIPEFDQEGTLPREAPVMRMPSWTIINEKQIVMAMSNSAESLLSSTVSHDSEMSNHLPSSFHEVDAIRVLSDSEGSSKKSQRRNFNNARTLSHSSSMGDMPDLASINESSMYGSVETPPYISTGGDLDVRQYPGGVPRAPSPVSSREPSLWQRFERVPSSGRLGLVSATGDVFTDDVSRYSFSKFFVDPTKEAISKRQTGVISSISAGDIHQMVDTVRFPESPASSESGDSSESDDITLDSDDEKKDANKFVDEVDPRYRKSDQSVVQHSRSGVTPRSRGGGVAQHSRGVYRSPKNHEKIQFGRIIRKRLSAMRRRAKCLTKNRFCDNPKRYNDIAKSSKRLERFNSWQCLLHTEDSPYDRSHILEDSRLKIDDNGFVVRR